jgi:MYXO-CTERM domain-containing protein
MSRTAMRLVTMFSVAFCLAMAINVAQAGVVFTVTQDGSNVFIEGSGSYNLTGATNIGNGSQAGFINSSVGLAVGGPFQTITSYALTIDPGPLGTGAFVNGSLDTGDVFGFDAIHDGGFITVPEGYTGGPLAGTTTIIGQSLASLGLHPGTFVYGIPNDTLTVMVVASVPEPSSLVSGLLGVALAGGYWLRCRRRRDA